MSLIRKSSASKEFPHALQADAACIPKNIARGADVQRKRARSLAKQQQASEPAAAAAIPQGQMDQTTQQAQQRVPVVAAFQLGHGRHHG